MSEQITALARVMTADTKISRSEIIDLIIEELTSDVDRELAQVNKELEQYEGREWTHEEVKHLIKKQALPKYELMQVHGGGWHFYVTDDGGPDAITVSAKDPLVKDFITEMKGLQGRRDALYEQKRKLDGNKKLLKASIMKRVLEGTAEGRNVLEQISQLKVTLRKQLGK
jgi:hypothetical protein